MVELANGFEVGVRDKEKLKVASKLLAWATEKSVVYLIQKLTQNLL